MTRPKHRPPPLLWDHRHLVAGALAVVLASGIGGTVVDAAADAAPDGRQPTAAAFPTATRPDPTVHATGARPLPVPVTPASAPSTTAAGPTTAPTLTRACRCGPRTTPTTTATPPAATTTSTAPDPPPSDDPPVQPAAAGLLELVNRDRATAGCPPVTAADDLMSQARTHSNGQAAADSMFHSASIQGYDTWGENVAVGYDTEAAAHQGWMDSPGHRANILGCQFTVIGFASADSASGVRYWTEMFAA
jgi:uncharacterized protein YkwD